MRRLVRDMLTFWRRAERDNADAKRQVLTFPPSVASQSEGPGLGINLIVVPTHF